MWHPSGSERGGSHPIDNNHGERACVLGFCARMWVGRGKGGEKGGGKSSSFTIVELGDERHWRCRCLNVQRISNGRLY